MIQRENQQFIFGCIFLLANKLQLLGDKLTEELTLKQWFLLNIIQHMENKFPNYNEIAKAFGTSRQNVSKMISVLHKKGMVDLHQSKSDHRAINVTLTEKCFDYFSSKENVGNMLLDKLYQDTSLIQIEQTAMLLGKMLQNADSCIDKEEMS